MFRCVHKRIAPDFILKSGAKVEVFASASGGIFSPIYKIYFFLCRNFLIVSLLRSKMPAVMLFGARKHLERDWLCTKRMSPS